MIIPVAGISPPEFVEEFEVGALVLCVLLAVEVAVLPDFWASLCVAVAASVVVAALSALPTAASSLILSLALSFALAVGMLLKLRRSESSNCPVLLLDDTLGDSPDEDAEVDATDSSTDGVSLAVLSGVPSDISSGIFWHSGSCTATTLEAISLLLFMATIR